MAGTVRAKALYGAITLVLIAMLGVGLAVPEGASRWVISTVWIACIALIAAAFAAGLFLARHELAGSQRALGESERRFRSMFQTASMGVAVSTPGGPLVDVNEAFAAMLGYEPGEMVGLTVRDITHPEDAEVGLQNFKELFAGIRKTYTIEKRYVRKDGSAVWARVNASLVRDQNGEPELGIAVVEDISDRKLAEQRLREAEIKYRMLVEQLPLVTYIDALDERSTNLYTSPQIELLLGYSVEEWQGDPDLFARLLHPEDRGRVLAEIDRTNRSGEPFLEEYRLLARDGRTVWFRDEAVIVHDDRGHPIHAQGYLLDISDRKGAEQEREQLLETLEGQNEQLRALDTMKDEFVALVSHELRTPLTSILGYLELVLEGEAGEVNEDQRQFLSVVERNSRRLLRLVGDLLFVAQIEAGKLALEYESVDLGLIVSECIEAARPRATEKQIELVHRLAPVPPIRGDRVRLAQLLDNLVSNAIKFTPEGGNVTVGLGHRSGSISLEVADTGMGIPQGEQSQLFERFFRTSGATRNAIQGTGLGLVITKAIAEAHGGRILLESEENVGTTFRVELPIRVGVEAMDEAA